MSEADFYESEKSENSTTHVSNKKEDFRRKNWKEWEEQSLYQLRIGISFENISDAKRCLELIQNNFPNILYATHLFR
jgi:predicted ATPase